ncbi:MAG: ankyrin repeat domain-containing protein [Nitrospinae bacterium]|nr:ankyrin repeat domain-containing protein [Nitrospinota bacterium]
MKGKKSKATWFACLFILLTSISVSKSVAADSVPKGWTRLHWAAWTGTAKEIKHLILGKHNVNEVTDNSAKIHEGIEARSEAVEELKEAILQLLHLPAKPHSPTNRWKKFENSLKGQFGKPEDIIGTYLIILARYHQVIHGDTIVNEIMKRGVYEACIEQGGKHEPCKQRQPDKQISYFININMPSLETVGGPKKWFIFIPFLLAKHQFDRYQRCLMMRNQKLCANQIPPSPVSWKDFDSSEHEMPSYRATPHGLLTLVKANEVIRRAYRNHKATALHLASASGDASKVKQLLQNGAWIDNQAGDGTTPLHRAAQVDAVEVVKELIEADANLEIFNHKGYTPLHVAVVHRARRSVKELLGAGADPNSETKQAETPMWLATLWGPEGWMVRNILERWGGRCGKLCQVKHKRPAAPFQGHPGPKHRPRR